MNSNDRSRWQVRFLVLTIFVIGFAAGALSMHLYRGRAWGFGSPGMRGRFEQTLDNVDFIEERKLNGDDR